MHKNKELKEYIRQNKFNVLDGIGMKTGLFLKGYGILSDLNGTDLFPLFISKILSTSLNVFLLGASKENIEQTVKKLSESVLMTLSLNKLDCIIFKNGEI